VAAVYLDNNATTIPDASVLEAIEAASVLVNPASPHQWGQEASHRADSDREMIAAAIGCRPQDVVFTSGATEANNLAILGAWRAHRSANTQGRTRIAFAQTEHPAVLESARALVLEGASLVELPVEPDGRINLSRAAGLIDERTFLVSAMMANNETGVINDVAAIRELAHANGAIIHTDATQAMGRIPVNFGDLGVDLLSLSGHKFHGPRGIGALVKSRKVHLIPLMFGGGQEHELRPGTLNTPGVAGIAAAAALIPKLLASRSRMSDLRDQLWIGIRTAIPSAVQNGSTKSRLPNTLNVRFPGADNEAVLAGLSHVMCSTGSACASGRPEPSHVLTAMGLTESEASESLRLSLSHETTEEEIRIAYRDIAQAVEYVHSALARGVS